MACFPSLLVPRLCVAAFSKVLIIYRLDESICTDPSNVRILIRSKYCTDVHFLIPFSLPFVYSGPLPFAEKAALQVSGGVCGRPSSA